MTRRARNLRLIARFDDATQCQSVVALLVRHGTSILTDEAVAQLARSIVTDHRMQQRFNREHRARRAS